MYHYYSRSRPLPITFFLSRPNHVIRSDFVSHPAGFPKQCQPLSMTWLEAHGWLTLWQRDGDDDAVSGSYPQAVAGDHQSGDPHEGEAQLTGACDTHSISRLNGTAGLSKDSDKLSAHPASCWRTARCQHPAGAGMCVRGRAWGSSPDEWTPRYRRHPTPAASPDSPYEDERRTISVREEQ